MALTKAKAKPKTASGPFVRRVRPAEKGLLLLYPLDHNEIDYPEGCKVTCPIFGFAISFPEGIRNEKVEYQVNTQYWQARYGDDDADE